jgi:tetratricopeptide (TPR) repeat protein
MPRRLQRAYHQELFLAAKRNLIALLLVCTCGGSPRAAPDITIMALPTVAQTAPIAVTPPPPRRIDLLDVRDSRHGPRAASLVATELQNLENLLAVTPMNSPDRPQLLRRLAEDYVEQRKSTGAGGDKAIDRYSTLTQQYPSYPLLDEVLYFVAIEYEAAQKLMDARKTYYELIKQHPSSRYIPAAYFAFGEMFVQEGKVDPSKWEFARQAYTEVIKFPNDALRPWALWRLGQVLDQQGDHGSAQAMYAQLRRGYQDSEAIEHIGETP